MRYFFMKGLIPLSLWDIPLFKGDMMSDNRLS